MDKEEFQRRLKSAVQELPSTADMLYLEYCYEQCDDICYKADNFTYIAKAFKPRYGEREGGQRQQFAPASAYLRVPSRCTAAIIFTHKGARRVMALCKSAPHSASPCDCEVSCLE